MNQRQTLFLKEYLTTSNATESYKRAYGITDDNVAAVNGSKLLRNAKVSRAIQEHNQKTMEAVKITIEDVVRRINHLADFGKDDYVKLKALDMLAKHLGLYISPAEMIDKLSEEQINDLVERIIKRGKNETL